MIDEKNCFGQAVKNDLRTYANIWKIVSISGQLGNWLLIAIDLSKQQALDADPKAIKQISYFCKLRMKRTNGNVFHYLKSRRNRFRFITGNCESIIVLFGFNIISI